MKKILMIDASENESTVGDADGMLIKYNFCVAKSSMLCRSPFFNCVFG